MNRCTQNHFQAGERGSFLFFTAAFVIPFLFLLGSLSIDLTAYFAEVKRIQEALDESTLLAYRYLPYESQAEEALLQQLKSRGLLAEQSSISISQDVMSIDYEESFPLIFSTFFGDSLALPIHAHASARGSVMDVAIVVDTSSYLAPNPEDSTATPWGSPSQWPSSRFFQHSVTPYLPNGERMDAHLATQQCFNPAFQSIKAAAISLFDYFQTFSQNSLGVLTMPIPNAAPLILRPVRKPGWQTLQQKKRDVFFPQQSTNFIRHDWCAALAEREPASSPYRLTPERKAFFAEYYPKRLSKPAQMIENASWTFDPAYEEYLLAREAIWSLAVQRGATAPRTNTVEALQFALGELAGAPPRFQERQGLAAKVEKAVFLLAGDLPRSNAQRFPEAPVVKKMQELLTSFQQQALQMQSPFRLYYVLIEHHEGGVWGPTSGTPHITSSDREAFQALLQNAKSTYFAADLLSLDTSASEESMENIIATLALSRKTALLSR